jgi:hypothetical protein
MQTGSSVLIAKMLPCAHVVVGYTLRPKIQLPLVAFAEIAPRIGSAVSAERIKSLLFLEE